MIAGVSIRMRLAPALAALAIALAGAGLARTAWRGHTVRADLARRYSDAERALAEGHPEHVRPLEPRAAEAAWLDADGIARWDALGVRAAVACNDGLALLALHERAPRAVAADEAAACLTARALALTGAESAARALETRWQAQGVHPEWWLALDADIELAQGRLDRARSRLAGAKLSGAADGGRLCRLALLWLKDDPVRAWGLLEQGVACAPARADLRLVRARVLEATGRATAAESELETGVRANPHDASLVDALAELHRRAGRFDRAVASWERLTAPPAWLTHKAAFVRRVALPGGSLAPLPHPAGTRAETPEERWLTTLDAIRRSDWATARDALARDRGDAATLAPHLFGALTWLVERRLAPPADRDRLRPAVVARATPHSFFERVACWPTGTNAERSALVTLVDGPAGPALACLAAGWRSAGLALLPTGQLQTLPGWARFTLAEALRLDGRADRALEVLDTAGTDPVVELARANALIASGRAAGALPILIALARSDDAAGRRARLLLDACRRPEAR